MLIFSSPAPSSTPHAPRPCLYRQPACAGFTLVEFMIALSILAILVALAAPSFQEVMRQSRLTSQTNDLLGGLQSARAEAIRRNRTVRFCSTANDWAVYLGTDIDTADVLKSSSNASDVTVPVHCTDFRSTGMPHECDCDDDSSGDLITDGEISLSVGDQTKNIHITVGSIYVD